METDNSEVKKNEEVELSGSNSVLIKAMIGVIVLLVLGIIFVLITNYKTIFGVYPEGQHPSELEKKRIETLSKEIDQTIMKQEYSSALLKVDELAWRYEPESNPENVLLYDKQREVLRQTVMELIKQQELTYNLPISSDSAEIYKVLGSGKNEPGTYLNLRSTLDSNYVILQRMTEGTRVRVIEKGYGTTGKWYKVQTRDTKKTGFAFSSFLKQINPLENCLVNKTWYYSLQSKNDAYWWFAEGGNFIFTSNNSRYGRNVWKGKWELDRYGTLTLHVTQSKNGKVDQTIDLFLEDCNSLKYGSDYFYTR